ncbi:DUF2442 domain-containing protein [Rhodoferax sp.]|uniref:DUF2442 domain-containing protein n=1 Tax=Rhodoferax sp. TaxID=50421 RepID=UPI00272536EC|nr:DUF2442 domain-containing protein [Rhodoferax sp.]MDO8318321.1 DUF2442 domain-containing protein [Rhodoferax sp.]MDP2680131.1 DUF2442 domain-containing protein [Rhodoferax sp.]
MREKLPRITSATALDKLRVHVSFEDGWASDVDLSGWIADFKSLKPLKDATLFARVALEEWGSGLTWDDEGPLSIAATTIYRLAAEQSGDAARSFDAWMMQHGFSASRAADTLGMSRRNVISYRTASRPIPKVVQLACKAIDMGAQV